MAINRELTLFLIIVTASSVTSQEHMSNEDINQILDKLILQTKSNETVPVTEVNNSYNAITESQPGNDSNIYYFKSLVTPRINYRSSSEIMTQQPNKTAQNFQIDDEDIEPISEELFPGKITRKSFMEMENQKRMSYGPGYRTGNVDDQDFLEDFIKKEAVPDINAIKDNKPIAYTKITQQNQQLNSLHNYPEIIIDHVTYDNDENDKEYNKNKLIKMKTTHESQYGQSVITKGDINKLVNPPKSVLRTRYNIPEEEIEEADKYSTEHFAPKNYLTPEMKGLIEAIIQKKVIHDNLLKQTTESETRKQSILLEKILQRLPILAEHIQTNNNAKASYSLRHERISPSEIGRLSHLHSSLETLHRNIGHHLSEPYFNVPPMRNKWEVHNHLLSTLRRRCRPDTLKRTHIVAGLLDRLLSKVDYRPSYYDTFKK